MKYATGRPTMTRTGPNDARRVVWAIGELLHRRSGPWYAQDTNGQRGEGGIMAGIMAGARDATHLEPQVCFFIFYFFKTLTNNFFLYIQLP